jgi:HlyD family secretion protein
VPLKWLAQSTGAVLTWLIVLAGGGTLGYWYLWPVEVVHYDVVERLAGREITGPGVLDANNKVIIAARINGFLAEIAVDRNAVVRKGDLLARLDDRELRHQRSAAKATKRAAEEAVREAEIEQRRAEIALRRATQTYERQLALVKNNNVSQAQFDLAKTELNQAEAGVSKSKVSIERAKALALTSSADVDVLTVRLAETVIKSPINGVVIARGRSTGDLLTPGAELMQIVAPDSMRVFARFDESSIDSLKPGQTAMTRFASDPRHLLPGRVERISRQVDQETREFTVEIALDTLPQSWAVGQRAVVTVLASSLSPRLVVPQRLLARRNGIIGVWINRNGRAEWVQVTVGFPSGNDIEITRGLKPGETVLEPTDRYMFQPVVRRGPRP